MSVCIYMCVRVCICKYVYICIYIYMHIYVYVYLYIPYIDHFPLKGDHIIPNKKLGKFD